MADNQYKIELGVKLDTNDLKTEIAKIDGKHKVKLGVDLGVKDIQDRIKAYNSNTNNIKVKLKATLDTDDLKKQINSINLSGKGKGIAVPIDATSLNSSLEKIESAVIDIKNAFGSLDNSNTKSLVSSVNLIANALEKATNESNGLIASLSALSKKDFSVNIGVASKSNPISKNLLYGDKVKEIFPQLQQQKDAIIKYLQKYYEDIYAAEIQARKSAGNRKSIQKGSKVHSTDPLSIISNLTGVDINKAWDLFEKTSAPLKTTGKNKDNFKDRMNEINDLINSLMKGAEAKGIDLSSVVSEFSTSSNELVKSASDIQTGVKETEESFEKLKQILNGGGIDADGLGEALKPISQDLAEIKQAFESLSSIGTIDGLTASFKDLSEVLDKLISNVALVKNALGDGLGNITGNSVNSINNIEKTSDAATSAVIQNEKKKQEAYKATADAVGYHAGVISKLNKAETNGMFYHGGRNTGYYGTGHYFVDSAHKHELDNDRQYSNLPYTSVDLSQYDNLFKAITNDVAQNLHGFLHNLTEFTRGSDEFGVSELFEQFKSVFGDTVMDIAEFGNRLEQLKSYMTNSMQILKETDRNDSVTTQFMKSLGYGGVDTRGTRYADTYGGIVIYDLKEESILQANITDELQKQGQMLEKINYEKGQVFDKSEDNKIQGIIDAQNKKREINEEFKNSFDTTGFEKADADLTNAKNRLTEIDETIERCQYSLNNLDQEYKEFSREISQLGFDDDAWLLLDDDEEEWKKRHAEDYQTYINKLSQEKDELQSKIPVLEEVYDRESQLANEAYERAKQTVEQRHLEAQQTQETANAVVQNEERKQQAHRETANIYNQISKDISLVRDNANFEQVFEVSNQAAQEAQIHFQELLANEKAVVSVTEQFDSDKHLQSFAVNIQRATGEVETLRYAMKNLAMDGEDDNWIFAFQGASTNDSAIDKQIEKSVKKANDLQIKLDKIKSEYSDLGVSKPIKEEGHIKSLANQYDKVQMAIEGVRKADITTFSSMVSNAEREKSVLESMVREFKNAENVSNKMKGTDLTSGIDIAKNNLRKFKAEANWFPQLSRTVQELDDAIEGVGDKPSLDQFNDQLRVAKSELQAVKAELSSSNDDLANKIRIDIDTEKFENKISQLHTQLDQLTDVDGSLDKLRASIKQVDDAYDAMTTATDDESLIQAQKRFAAAVEKTNNELKIQAREQRAANNAARLTDSKNALKTDMLNWLKKNSKAAKEYKGEIDRLIDSLDKLDQAGVNGVRRRFNNIDRDAEFKGLKGLNFLDSMKNKIKEYSVYFGAAEMFMYAEQGLRSMFEQVKLIDSAMTELKKVTNETDAAYDKFLGNAANRAKEIGTTIDGLVSSTADFARLGYGFEDAQGLAEVANIYAVVGDEIEGVEGATESLISTMAAFKDEMNGMSNTDFAMSIIDKFNEIGNNFAISSGGIGEALERSASSLMAANNTIDESIALITAANTVVQDPTAVGTAFKTISMRIRGAKTELEEAGLETEGMVDSTAKLRSEILALSGVDIMENANEFKSTYKIMDELAQKWEDLSDIQQATVTELIAGKRQGNIVSSLMTNFDTARDALETSLNSSGSAMAEHEKWQQSLEAQINSLKASWQALSQTFMNYDFLKIILDGVIALVDGLTKLTDTIGSFGTIGLITGIIGIVKNFGTLKTLAKDVFTALTTNAMDCIGSFDKWAKASDGVVSGGKKLASSMSAIVGGIGLAVAAISLIITAYKNYKQEISEARQETIQASDKFLDSASSFEQAYIKYSGKTNLTVEEEKELESAIKGTVDALDDKSSALHNAVNSSNDYVASLEAIAKAELEASHRAAKDKKDSAENELRDAVKGWSSIDGSEVDVHLGGTSGGKDKVKKAVNIAKEVGGSYYKRTQGREDFSLVLNSNASILDILDYYNTLLEYKNRLSDEGLIDTDQYTQVTASIDKLSESIETYTSGVYDAAKAQYQLSNGIPKTTEEYLKMRESILRSDDIENLSLDTKSSIANTLDSEYKQIFDLTYAEAQARKLVGIIESYGDGTKDGTNEIGVIETFLNMRTAVNNNDCTVGEYMAQFDEINKITANWSDEEKKLLNTSFGIDTDTIKQQYKDISDYLSRFYYEDTRNMDRDEEYDYKFKARENRKKIEEFLNGLTADELAAVIDIRTEIDWENTSAEDIRKQIEDRVKLNEALNFNANIEVDTTALEALNTALAESASAMGLSEESIDSLKAKYSDLEGYNPHTLFEKTANGVKVNRDELAKLEKKYNDLTKTEVQEHLDTLVEEYNKCTKAIDGNIGSQEKLELISKREKYAQQIEELAEYQAQLEGVTGAYQRWIDAQNTPEDYEGYQAVATGREDIEDEIGRGFISNATKEYIDLLSGEDLVGGTIDDYANAWEKLDQKVGSTSYSIHDFFTVNDDGDITSTGIDRFFKGLQQDFKGEVAKFNEKSGKWEYDFSQENLQKIQDEWGIGIEAIELLLEAAASAGYDVDWGGIFDDLDLDTSNFESLVSVAEQAQKELNKLKGYEDLDFNFSTTTVEAATSELEKAQKTYNELVTGDDGKININAEGADNARVILATLLVQKQQLEDSEIAINISTSGLDESQAKAVAWVQDFRTKYKNLEIAISTGEGIEEAKTELETVKTSLGELDGDTAKIAAQLVLGEGADSEGFKTQVNSAIDSIGEQKINVGFNLNETAISDLNSNLLSNFTVDATAKITNVDKSQLETVETGGMVTWAENVDGVSKSFEATGTVNWDDDVKNVKTSFSANGTVNWTSGNNVKVKVISEANGTANANGTAQSGRAFARGNWGIKGSGTALVGELGMETLVRGGRFYTIGDNGAEFIKYQPNDIIFNHKQTEELFKYGKVVSDGGRGRMYANGSAFADGTALWQATASNSKFASNRKAITADGDSASSKSTKKKKLKKDNVSVDTTVTKDKDSTSVGTKVNYSANASESDFAKNNQNKNETDKETKEFEETFDWIATAISRIEREIDNLDNKVNNTYKSWGERNSALTDEIGKVGTEITLQSDAAAKYWNKAGEFLNHDSDYAKKIQEGTLDIDTLNQDNSNEELVEKIKEYQKWYELYLKCTDAAEKLKQTEAELYAQRFEHIQSQYDGILQGFDHTETMLNEYISQAEAKGHIVSKQYYDALIANEHARISELKGEQKALVDARDKLVEEGKIDKYSEEWYNMCAEIDGVTQAIEEGETALIGYNNALRDLDFEKFELIQERISDVTDEANFLIELMSNEKLFDDNGKLTDKGMATMGLHGQNINTYMYQADDYGAKVKEIDSKIASGEYDQYDENVIAKRREYVELQREAILNAEQEKQAIKDLVSEGIDKELEALQERIDLHNEELESMKDLYDYQKNVQKQSEEIASLEKQRAAYLNDSSSEGKAKLQEITVSLKEAREDLQETEYDRYISDQSKLLDNLYESYSEVLNTRLDNTDALIAQITDAVNIAAGAEGTIATALGAEGAIAKELVANGVTIKTTLETEAKNVGTTLSSAMRGIWNVDEGNAKSVLTTYGEGFQGKQTTTNTILGDIKTYISRMVDDVDKDAQTKVNSNKTSSSSEKDPTKDNTSSTGTKPATTTTTSNKSSGDGKPKIGDKVKFLSGKYYYDSQGVHPAGSKNQGKEVYITNVNTKSWATHPYHISTGKKLGSGDLGWLKLNQISGYATGKKNFLNNEIAWTQENGQELIVRPSDGAILTPVAKGDSVLTSAASNNIWDMANNPSEFIKDNLKLDKTNVPNSSNAQSNITQHFENITFSMPNVHGYNELLREMQRDPKFEKLILSMTIDQIAGKSSLAKGKSIR